mgnify:CR=1 FL=1
MKNNLWIFFAIISGFTGFLLGYSTPPMMEVGFNGAHSEISTIEQQETSSDQDLEEYYKKLQELQQ